MSDRTSASLPSNCSGDMYWKVPMIVPSTVSGCDIVASEGDDEPAPIAAIVGFARPKSNSFTRLSEHDVRRLQITMYYAAAMRPLQSLACLDPVLQYCSGGSQGLAFEVFHDQEIRPVLVADVMQVQMLGWFREEMARASRSKRCLASGVEGR